MVVYAKSNFNFDFAWVLFGWVLAWFEADYEAAKAFRRRMQFIRAAVDERAFYAMKSLHYEKLKGDRSHERSMRLNDQWRLVLRIESTGERTVVIVSIEDYH